GCDLLLLQFAHLARAQVELLPEGRVASDVASSWLPTTFCRRRPVEPRPGAFALHAATSFHCCPRAKKPDGIFSLLQHGLGELGTGPGTLGRRPIWTEWSFPLNCVGRLHGRQALFSLKDELMSDCRPRPIAVSAHNCDLVPASCRK